MSNSGDREVILRHSRECYAHRATYYDLIARGAGLSGETKKELDFVEHVIRTHSARPVKKIVDIACGGGRHIVGLAKRGYECMGYDLVAERVEIAKALAKRMGVSVSLAQRDATLLPRDKHFDAVLALYILYLLPSDDDVRRCLAGVHRLLSPGGVLVCNIYNPFTRGSHWVKELVEKGSHVEESRGPGIRIIEIGKARTFDPIKGELWEDETAIIKAPDGLHIFHDRERVRIFTYWDIRRYLEEAGFREVVPYADWKYKPRGRLQAEQIVFVARK
jgi:SAM-dependent methyltransferase